MKLRSIKIEKKLIPEWNGNRELSPDEQMVIHFPRIPGTSEKAMYMSFSHSQQNGTTINYNDQSLCAALVGKIDNFELDVAGSTEKIRNGVDLAGATCSGLSDLFSEIRDHQFPPDEDLTPGE